MYDKTISFMAYAQRPPMVSSSGTVTSNKDAEDLRRSSDPHFHGLGPLLVWI